MLFSSYPFIFVFLPLTLAGFFAIGGGTHRRAAMAWLVVASLFFYGWWNPRYLGLIAGSIAFNYWMGRLLSEARAAPRMRQGALAVGIAVNLGLLGYFKYAGFLVHNLNAAIGKQWSLDAIVLPLAISFFTFQQLTYLVDAYRGETRGYRFLDYCLFVSFFPQLIAGPILHHREMLPQFSSERVFRPSAEHLAVGLTLFTVGLFKKTVVADGVALYASPVFEAAAAGQALTLFEAWGGALAYTFQLYFDFSGYSDMALGLARLFGIVLPLNFYSPYKANDIIDFWRRWHITLSRFLREYLYIPLGGSRHGKTLRYVNLMLTMLLGGLWHGAGWTFVAWGGLHGLYLCVNHGWRAMLRGLGRDPDGPATLARRATSRLLTFLAVVVGWVFFRAASFPAALRVLEGMLGFNGAALAEDYRLKYPLTTGWVQALGGRLTEEPLHFDGWGQVAVLLLLLAWVWFAPNAADYLAGFRPYLDAPAAPAPRTLRWRPSLANAFLCGLALFVAVRYITRSVEFLYFQF